MSSTASGERILIYCPTGRDGRLAYTVLAETGLRPVRCDTLEQFCRELAAGADVAVLADEALDTAALRQIRDTLERQPPWSDLPILVFTRTDRPDRGRPVLEALGNVTLLERPVRINTLLSALRAAVRARQRQYQVRDLLARLEEQSRRKDEFLAMLGHELRNPLAAIQTALQVLEQADARSAQGGRVPSELRSRPREVIQRQLRLLTRLVDDLLDVSRVTLGKIALHRQRLDLRTVAERCVQSMRMRAEEEQRPLHLSLPPEPVPVEGDPMRLEQVILNLLSNALKYTQPGGEIRVAVRREPEAAIVSVADSGIGIAPEMQEAIFELFTQGDTTLDRAQGGLGIGLTLARRLVEMHGGSLSVWSAGLGKGAEFTVRLPLAPAASPPADAPEAEEPTARRSARVLIVEDNEDGRETLRELLELSGFAVETAGTGPEGLAKALEQRPEVVLIDIGLPGMNGYELARALRERLDGECPRLIAMTGYGQPEDRQRALQAGFDHHLVKPVDTAELTRLLDAGG